MTDSWLQSHPATSERGAVNLQGRGQRLEGVTSANEGGSERLDETAEQDEATEGELRDQDESLLEVR
jgi:hypothetical protein